jgi:hypothetical protein
MTETSDSRGPERGDDGAEQTYDGQDDPSYVSDDQLPEDLRPSDDNPLAMPPDEDDPPTRSTPDAP